MSFVCISLKLCLDCICSQVLDLFDGHRWRPIVLELTALLWVHLRVGSLLWMKTFSSPSLSKLFMKDWTGPFSSFLVSLAIFSSYSLMHALFSLLSFVSFSSIAFMTPISSFQLFVPIVMTCMTAVLEDSALVSKWKACFSVAEEESDYSSLPPHRVEFEALRGFGLHPFNDTFYCQFWYLGERVVLTLEYKTQEGGELCPCLIFANSQIGWTYCLILTQQ